MEEYLVLKDGGPLKTAQEAAPSDKDWEKCFVRVINSMDNEAVAKALCCCEILPENACDSLKDILTVYRMSYLMVKVILCIDKSDFDKLCYHICNREQVKQLSDLYHAYQSILVSNTSSNESTCEDQITFTLGYSVINLQFILLTMQIQAEIENPLKLLADCEQLMADKKYSTPLFEKDYLKSFNEFKPEVLFQALSIFWTWSDHSILRELLSLGKHTAALSLLDKFDQYLESAEPLAIEKFPLPMLSKKMIPGNINVCTHTILAIKIKTAYDKCTLQHIFEARKSLINNCEITRNALQLLGVLNNYSNFTMIYWLIPTCAVSLITTKIMDTESLHEKEIMEIAIYPNTIFCTGTNTVKFGPLACLMDISSKNTQPAKVVKGFGNLMVYLSRTEELPQIIRLLLSDLDDSQTQSKQSLSEKELLDEKIKEKDVHIKDLERLLKKKKDFDSKSEQKHKSLQDKEEDYGKSETKSLVKVKTESLKDEVSELQSQMMMKDNQIQKLLEENKTLKKLLKKVKEKEENEEKNKVENNNIGPHMPFENDQSLSVQLQKCKDEIEHLSRQTNKMENENAQLINENETLNKHLKESQLKLQENQLKLEEKCKRTDLCEQKIEQLKNEKSAMNKNMTLVNKKLEKCKKKKQGYKSAYHHATTAASIASKPKMLHKDTINLIAQVQNRLGVMKVMTALVLQLELQAKNQCKRAKDPLINLIQMTKINSM